MKRKTLEQILVIVAGLRRRGEVHVRHRELQASDTALLRSIESEVQEALSALPTPAVDQVRDTAGVEQVGNHA